MKFFGPLLFLASASLSAAELRPFVTDGCTAWSEGTRERPNLWLHCCVRHDLSFWAGGLTPSRDEADLALRDCVAATGAKLAARIIYAGVRIGARSPRKIAGKQWGNAWSARATRKTEIEATEIDELERAIMDSRYDGVLDLSTRRAFIESLR